MHKDYSEKFRTDAAIVLNIYHKMFSECRIYQDHERKIIHKFDDSKYATESDSLLQSNIGKLKVRYMLKHSSLKPENELHLRFMTMLEEIERELFDKR